jgi:integrase
MAGGRPQLAPGTYGEIWVSSSGKPYKARARFRDEDGVTRSVARFGQTKDAARRALRDALAERARSGRIDRDTTVRELAKLWLADVQGSDRAARTKEHYTYCVDRYVLPRIGSLRVSEVDTGVCDLLLKDLAGRSRSAAKSTRAVLNGMFRLAVARGAASANPVRETSSIAGQRSLARALTLEKANELADGLRSDPRALPPSPENPKGKDLADLVDLMLATGCRIGEALACRHMPNADDQPLLDLEAGTWEINATVIRVKGAGLMVQERPKSAAGRRVLHLPPPIVLMLRRRQEELRLRPATVQVLSNRGELREVDGVSVAFPSPFAPALRDPSNLAADLREVFDRLNCPKCGGYGWHAHLKTEKQQMKPPKPRTDEAGNLWNEPCDGNPPFSWVYSHIFRKTVATRLDAAGWTGRQAADQLGHANPSMTLDVYFGRKVVNADAAQVLDR